MKQLNVNLSSSHAVKRAVEQTATMENERQRSNSKFRNKVNDAVALSVHLNHDYGIENMMNKFYGRPVTLKGDYNKLMSFGRRSSSSS